MKRHHTVQESFLYPIYEQVNAETDFVKCQAIIVAHLHKQANTKQINHMLFIVEHEITEYRKLLFWFYNNLQAYTDNHVVQPIPR